MENAANEKSRKTWNPVSIAAITSIIVGVISGLVTWGAVMVSIGEYKEKVDAMMKTVSHYSQFSEDQNYLHGQQVQINQQVLNDLQKLELRLDKHLGR